MRCVSSGRKAVSIESIEAMLQQATLRRQQLDSELRDLDLNPVRWLLRRLYQWPLARILEAEHEFLEFLSAIRRNPAQPQVPTAEADTYWHTFLLITPLYVLMCARVFGGKLLLHDPFHSFAAPRRRRMNFPAINPGHSTTPEGD
jgi:hypothetical protein